jgi:hypothetical protein
VTSATRGVIRPPSRGPFLIRNDERVRRDSRVEVGLLGDCKATVHSPWGWPRGEPAAGPFFDHECWTCPGLSAVASRISGYKALNNCVWIKCWWSGSFEARLYDRRPKLMANEGIRLANWEPRWLRFIQQLRRRAVHKPHALRGLGEVFAPTIGLKLSCYLVSKRTTILSLDRCLIAIQRWCCNHQIHCLFEIATDLGSRTVISRPHSFRTVRSLNIGLYKPLHNRSHTTISYLAL